MRTTPTAIERFLVEWSRSLDEPDLPELENLQQWLMAVSKLMYVLEQSEHAEELKDLIHLWKVVKIVEGVTHG